MIFFTIPKPGNNLLASTSETLKEPYVTTLHQFLNHLLCVDGYGGFASMVFTKRSVYAGTPEWLYEEFNMSNKNDLRRHLRLKDFLYTALGGFGQRIREATSQLTNESDKIRRIAARLESLQLLIPASNAITTANCINAVLKDLRNCLGVIDSGEVDSAIRAVSYVLQVHQMFTPASSATSLLPEGDPNSSPSNKASLTPTPFIEQSPAEPKTLVIKECHKNSNKSPRYPDNTDRAMNEDPLPASSSTTISPQNDKRLYPAAPRHGFRHSHRGAYKGGYKGRFYDPDHWMKKRARHRYTDERDAYNRHNFKWRGRGREYYRY
jgi:hypothetical protein